MSKKIRDMRRKRTCEWPSGNQRMVRYHDREWGVPLHNDRKLFEFMVLDAFQAGLSWAIVMKKRAGFERVFCGFDPKKIARFGAGDIRRLLKDKDIIRNRLKIMAAVENAKRFLAIKKEFGSFDKYIWQFVGGRPIVHQFRKLKELPAKTRESDAMSADLKKRGFKFVGSTICYAFMQAAGMVNDHLVHCFRRKDLARQ